MNSVFDPDFLEIALSGFKIILRCYNTFCKDCSPSE